MKPASTLETFALLVIPALVMLILFVLVMTYDGTNWSLI